VNHASHTAQSHSLFQVILRDHGFARVELPDDDWNIFWCAGQVSLRRQPHHRTSRMRARRRRKRKRTSAHLSQYASAHPHARRLARHCTWARAHPRSPACWSPMEASQRHPALQVNPVGLKYMKPHQRVNKFPKASALTLKANLWSNFARSQPRSPLAHRLLEAARRWLGPDLFAGALDRRGHWMVCGASWQRRPGHVRQKSSVRSRAVTSPGSGCRTRRPVRHSTRHRTPRETSSNKQGISASIRT
jgi:hypothetical protein